MWDPKVTVGPTEATELLSIIEYLKIKSLDKHTNALKHRVLLIFKD